MAWYNVSWLKRKPIVLTGGASGAQSNFQLLLTVTFDSDMKSDFSDIRVTQSDGTTLCDIWMESHTASTSAKIWVEFPTTPANTVEQTYYMYYGNSGASSAWSMTGTFPDLCDDFEDNDVTDWTGSTMAIESTTVKTGTYSGKATGATGPHKTGTSRTSDYYIDFDYRQPSATRQYISIGKDGGVASNCVFFRIDSSTLQYYDGSYHTVKTPFNANQWYKFKVLVHFAANTFDLWLDGVSIGAGYGTRGAISEHNDIFLFTNSQTEFVDNIFVHKYAANPATYAFGSEESSATSIPVMMRYYRNMRNN